MFELSRTQTEGLSADIFTQLSCKVDNKTIFLSSDFSEPEAVSLLCKHPFPFPQTPQNNCRCNSLFFPPVNEFFLMWRSLCHLKFQCYTHCQGNSKAQASPFKLLLAVLCVQLPADAETTMILSEFSTSVITWHWTLPSDFSSDLW